LEVGSWELADIKELKFLNLNLNINMMSDLGTLNFGSKALALPRDSIGNHYHKTSNFGR